VNPRQRAFLLVAAGVAFAVLTAAVASDSLDGTDRRVAATLQHVYSPALLVPAQAVALLGGVEVTTGLAAILFAFLWQAGYRLQSLALVAFLLANGLEELYKVLVFHPAPGGRLSHPDGPSITDLFEHGAAPGNSFPSGHVVRSVVIYGLAAFVVYRLALSERRGALAIAGAFVVSVAVPRGPLADRRARRGAARRGAPARGDALARLRSGALPPCPQVIIRLEPRPRATGSR